MSSHPRGPRKRTRSSSLQRHTHHNHNHHNGNRSGHRSNLATPPLLPSTGGGSGGGSPYRPSRPMGGSSGGGGGYLEGEASLRSSRVHVLQDVLRRTSLSELRDREIVDWLSETEGWLRRGEAAFASYPLAGPPPPALQQTNRSSTGSSGGGGTDGASNCHFAGAAELRLLVLGVLHTMPWWRVVESVDTGKVPSSSSSRPSGSGGKQQPSQQQQQQSSAAAKAVTRWHERIQVGFERVCLTLVEQSQHTVPGVIEVVMRPFHLRSPVHDGALRAIPTDSFLRIINAIASTYSAQYVLELFQTCLENLLPKRRWSDRRHHLAATAMLLHLALEGVVPAFAANSGNAHSFNTARGLMAAAAAAAANKSTAGLESDATDDSLESGDGGAAQAEAGVSAALAPLQLPMSLRRATGAHRPSSSGGDDGLSVSETEAEASDSSTGTGSSSGDASSRQRRPSGGSGKAGFSVINCTTNAGGGAQTPRTMLAQLPPYLKVSSSGGGGSDAVPSGGSVFAISVQQSNRMLAYRADIVSFLLRRLLEMELALEGDSADDGLSLTGDDFSDTASFASTSFSGVGSSSGAWRGQQQQQQQLQQRRGGGGAVVVGPGTSPALTHNHSHAGIIARDASGSLPSLNNTNCNNKDGPPSPSSPSSLPSVYTFSAFNNRERIAPAARPFMDILTDCTQLTFLALAADIRRQQATGVTASADWWREVVNHFLSAVRRVERPKVLLFLAPSLAMLGRADQAVDLLHKLVSMVTKGMVPLLQAGAAPPAGSGPGTSGSMSSQLRSLPSGRPMGGGGAAPMRMRRFAQAHSAAALSAQPVPMLERLRAAMFIFPLFSFMRPAIGSAEGPRKRLLKWVAKEMRNAGPSPMMAGSRSALHHQQQHGMATAPLPAGSVSVAALSVASLLSRSGGGVGGSLSRGPYVPSPAPSRLVEVVFAQCAAMSHAMGVDFLPGITTATPPPPPPPSGEEAQGPGSAWIDLAIRPLAAAYGLDVTAAAAGGGGSGEEDPSGSGEESAGPAAAALGSLEQASLLRPQLMEGCPWLASLRTL